MRRLSALLRRAIPPMKEAEYHAALNGLNIVFGAILGVNVAGIETLDSLAYMTLLALVAAVVTAILYIPASPHRLWYAAALVTIMGGMLLVRGGDDLSFGSIPLPDKLVPTLIVWTAMVAFVEFAPRERATVTSDPPAADEQPD